MDDINLFFACDDNYIPYLAVALQSIKENSNKKLQYNLKVLHTGGISEENINILKKDYDSANFDLEFVNIERNVNKIAEKLHTRDYYSKSTYYRLFIPNLYPELDKALYLDGDIVLRADVSKLYNIDLGDNYVAGVMDGVVASRQEFRDYAEKRLGVDSYKNYFNAGILLMNLDKLREINFEDRFLDLLTSVKFDVAQDQDYLNTICKGHAKIIDAGWNVMPLKDNDIDRSLIYLIHYNIDLKPWIYDGIKFEEYFWDYAKRTSYYDKIVTAKANYPKEKKDLCAQQTLNLIENARGQADDEEGNKKIRAIIDEVINKEYSKKDPERLRVLEQIDILETNGIFDVDVEEDPPTTPLLPNKVDYLRKKLSSKISRKIAYSIARKFMNKMIADHQLIIKEVKGIENWKNLESGAILTCNHFSPMDSFAMQYAYDETKFKKRRFYKVIREGNYTSFDGFYGYLMKHCNTLPLSSNRETMKKFLDAVDTILRRKEFILVYPEQSMWWNYRKPKPLKSGAFNFAVRNNVPVIPCFITMKDTEYIGPDGFPIQEYTINIMEPIYPDKSISSKHNIEKMKEENFNVWKKCYEETYGEKLVYKTRKNKVEE